MSEALVDRRSRASGPRSAEPKRGAGNAVYDPVGQKIGSAEEVFVNRDGELVVRQDTHWPPLDLRRHALLICNLRGRSPP